MKRNARQLPPMTDALLDSDLAAIDLEVKRRKKASPREPSALWAYEARIAALHRFDDRYPCAGSKKTIWPDLTQLDPA